MVRVQPVVSCYTAIMPETQHQQPQQRTPRGMKPEAVLAQISLQEGDTVADFGAGSGGFSIPAARRVGPAGRLFAVDVRDAILARLKRQVQRDYGLEHITVVVGDLETPGGSDIADSSIDVCMCINVLHQLDDPQVTAEEAYRVCKPGGRIVVVAWCDSHNGMGPPADRVVTEQRARTLYSNAGFELIEHIDAGDYHYGFLGRRPPMHP